VPACSLIKITILRATLICVTLIGINESNYEDRSDRITPGVKFADGPIECFGYVLLNIHKSREMF
jgi:hypothetical protein